MNPFWSQIAHQLSPYVPGEQPRIANLVKLNTNESPFGPSPLALEAMRAAAVDTLRLYPDPEATELREVLATHHGVKPEQVFVGTGSDEVHRGRHGFSGSVGCRIAGSSKYDSSAVCVHQSPLPRSDVSHRATEAAIRS